MRRAVIYGRDVVLQKTVPQGHFPATDTPRGASREFTREVREGLQFFAANTSQVFTAFVLLTYGSRWPHDGKLVAKHLNRLMTNMRKKFGAFAYLWVREFQRRGAPHFHICVSIPSQCTQKSWREKSQRWARIDGEKQRWLRRAWGAATREKGQRERNWSICSWELIDKPDGAKRYMLIYASKLEQKTIPEGYENPGRWWMPSRGISPRPVAVMDATDGLVAAVMGGREKDRNGNTYRVLHGAAEAWQDYDTDTGLACAVPAWQKALDGSDGAKGLARSPRPIGRLCAHPDDWVAYDFRRQAKRQAWARARIWWATPPLSRCIEWKHETREGVSHFVPQSEAEKNRPHPARWLEAAGFRRKP